MRAPLLAALLLSTAASAQSIRTGGGTAFAGGPLSAALELDESNTTCASTLALSWDTDENMGFQRSAADSLKMCLAGADALTLTATTFTVAPSIVADGADFRINMATASDSGLLISGTNTDPGVPAFQSCGSGHACARVIGEASRAASLLLSAGSANATGGNLLFSWADATDDRETWAIRQTATALTFVNIDEDSGSANGTYFQVTEKGSMRHGVGDALTISGASDTDDPTAAGSACRVSASGGAAGWIPSESTAVNGQTHCCTNTGTDTVTLSDSAGVYEGTTPVLGQWDSVCFQYVTDRWVQLSTSNN
jgi:hypothetical protein